MCGLQVAARGTDSSMDRQWESTLPDNFSTKRQPSRVFRSLARKRCRSALYTSVATVADNSLLRKLINLRVTFFVSLFAFVGMLGLYLVRHMPLRYFAWFCLLVVGYAAVELVMVRYFRRNIQKNSYLGVVLELALGILFVAAFYLFAVYVYPGMR